MLDQLQALIDRTERLLDVAERSGAIGQALAAITSMWKGYELIGRVSGEIKPAGGATINISQQMTVDAERRRAIALAVIHDPELSAMSDELLARASGIALPKPATLVEVSNSNHDFGGSS